MAHARLRLLHVAPPDIAEATARRTGRLIEAFGSHASHRIVGGGTIACAGAGLAVEHAPDFPLLSGVPMPGRLHRIAHVLREHDLVLSYGWSAIDAALAHTLLRERLSLPPLVHHEDGLDAAEAAGPRRTRSWYRRIALGWAAALIVPTRRLEALAIGPWQQPPQRIRRIPYGVDVRALARKPKPDAFPRVIKRAGEKWLGVAGASAEEVLPLLAFLDRLDESWQLVVLGDVPEREAIQAEALRIAAAHRVHFPGSLADPARALGLFDILALPGAVEPIGLCEAMAAGLAIVAPDSAIAGELLSPENAAVLTSPGDRAALAETAAALAQDPERRRAIGKANRDRAVAEFDERAMIESFRAAYAAALRRPNFP